MSSFLKNSGLEALFQIDYSLNNFHFISIKRTEDEKVQSEFSHLPENLIPVSCNRDCGGGCPLAAEIREGRPVKILDNPLRPDPLIRGCPRGYRALDAALSPDRLTAPLKRRGERGEGDFIPLTWDDALDEIAGKLVNLKSAYGSEGLMFLEGSGACRGIVHSTGGLTRKFFSHWGRTVSTRGYYSNTAAMFATRSVYGMGRAGQDPDTLRGARLVILWGANILDLRFGTKLEPVLRELKKEGVPFYVIDPRLTRTGRFFAEGSPGTVNHYDSHWLAVKPGTDAALMAAVLYQLLEGDQVEQTFIRRYVSGFEDLENWATGAADGVPKTPVWAASVCGLPVRQIEVLASAFGSAKPAALIPGLSIQRTVGGEEAYRMAMALQAARGNIGIPGGSSGGCLWDTTPSPRIASVESLGKGNFTSLRVPVNNWQDCVIEGKRGGWPADIRGIYSVGNNYLVQASDLNKAKEAFSRVELSVCHDLFLTSTALWSDYVLPATHFFERRDIVSASENYLYFSEKILDPPGDARDDFDIFQGLADRLGFGEDFGRGLTSDQWLDACIEDSEISDSESFRTLGIYDNGDHRRIILGDFISDPENHPLKTPSGLIDFNCKENLDYGFPPHPHFRRTFKNDENSGMKEGFLEMITPHARLRTNSQHSNLPWFFRQEYPLLHMNPADAAVREIREGDYARISGEEDSMVLPVHLTGEVRPGVVWAFQGNWEAENSVNRLTVTESTLPSRGSRTHSIQVKVYPERKS